MQRGTENSRPVGLTRALAPSCTAVLLVVLATLGGALGGETPLHLIDANPSPVLRARIIDGTWRRILPGFPRRQEFSLRKAPSKASLRFAIGLTLEHGERGKVSFEIVLRRPGRAPKLVYRGELDRTLWLEEDIDLSGYDLTGATLLLRKTLVEGERKVLSQANWGEPTLLPVTPPAATSVILISLDTLRADHVGIYGHAEVESPTLDKLARAGVWYQSSYSASTWTYPSHASLLHGLHPASLPSLTAPAGSTTTPPPRPPTLADLFRAGGYITAGFTGGGYMSDRWGFPNGFDSFYMFSEPPQTKNCTQDRFDGPVVFDRAERWLADHHDRPFFLFVHTYEVHDRCPVWPKGIGPYARWPDPGPQGRKRVITYYDSLVQRADALVAGLLSRLESLGLADKVVIAITSDHGEAFWEHGFYGHGCIFEPYDPLVRVPLIIRPPGTTFARGRIDTPVSAIDVAPTLLALANLPRPETIQGRVLPGLGGPADGIETPVIVHCEDKVAVRVGRHKLIANRKDGTEKLFDLEKDPGETSDLIDEAPEQAAALRKLAADYWKSGATDAGAQKRHLDDLDEQTRERLRALGYLE